MHRTHSEKRACPANGNLPGKGGDAAADLPR